MATSPAMITQGLSPRVRGNRLGMTQSLPQAGSIPAGAGEPPGAGAVGACARVYPRGCGGTPPHEVVKAQASGLSPRVRGNPQCRPAYRACSGSIPAGAGEPSSGSQAAPTRRVYPRGCGGTTLKQGRNELGQGLSPRVRGNHVAVEGDLPAQRSIPAGAGEPASSTSATMPIGVYPRGCGGNPGRPVDGSCHSGSIPAGAGEPRPQPRHRPRAGVYPRGCGGTRPEGTAAPPSQGLSPRVRGNRRRPAPRPAVLGSIPAGAGEPRRTIPRAAPATVYPRGCGGTRTMGRLMAATPGLSPRVRGNHRFEQLLVAADGSIPAGAGEPSGPPGASAGAAVYPRGCGGTLVL